MNQSSKTYLSIMCEYNYWVGVWVYIALIMFVDHVLTASLCWGRTTSFHQQPRNLSTNFCVGWYPTIEWLCFVHQVLLIELYNQLLWILAQLFILNYCLNYCIMFVRFTSQIFLIRENNNLQKYSVLNEFSAFYRKMNRL